MHQCAPPKTPVDDIARPIFPEPNADFKSSAPAVVVQCWCGLIENMDRPALDRFTRDIWRRFDHRDLESLKPRFSRGDANQLAAGLRSGEVALCTLKDAVKLDT